MGSPAALGDSLTLFEWTAPMPAMSASQLNEEEQMHALRKYVSGLDVDMESHQEHRAPMTRLVSSLSLVWSACKVSADPL